MKIRTSSFKWIYIQAGILFATYASTQEISQFTGGGTISFLSDAPAETIKATSDELRGIIDMTENTFAYIIPVNSFQGFNSALQKEHFHEHYMETKQFPRSTFTGKMVGLKECKDQCDTDIFAKGKLTIHGITRIVTIPVKFSRKNNIISARSNFQVALSDYDINIPLILEAKISPIIQVFVDVKLKPKSE